MSEVKLNEKHKIFCDLYIHYNLDSMKAYKKVYNCSDSVAKSGGNRMLKRDDIRNYLHNKLGSSQKNFSLSSDGVLEQLTKIATYKNDVMDETKEVIQTKDKLKALELMAKYHKLLTDNEQKTFEDIHIRIKEDN